MNFKERLDMCNIATDSSFCETCSGFDINDFFVQDTNALNIIIDSFKKGKNLIIASNAGCDKTLISQYIKSVLNINNAKTAFSPLVDIFKLVSYLEAALTESKQFVFGINIKTYKNILKTIKTLILIHYTNLKETDVENLLGLSDTVIVFVSKNEDGVFAISDIGEIDYTDDKVSLNNLYAVDINNIKAFNANTIEAPKEVPFEVYESDKKDEEVIETEIKKEEVPIAEEELTEEDIVEESTEEEFSENISNIEDEQAPPVEEFEIVEIEEPKKKVNKYKLLKEKVKNKKQQN